MNRLSSIAAEEKHLAYWKSVFLTLSVQPLAALQTQLSKLSFPDQGAGEDLKDGVELLLEMFPTCTLSQAQKALAMALGNLEEAVQLMVEEKVETGPLGANVKVLWQRQAKQHRGLEESVHKYSRALPKLTHGSLPPKVAVGIFHIPIANGRGQQILNL